MTDSGMSRTWVWDKDRDEYRQLTSQEFEDRIAERNKKWSESKGYATRIVDKLNDDQKWALRQELAKPAHYYGDGGTIHQSTELDVETHAGVVVAVWFRCMRLPFRQAEVDFDRGKEMSSDRTKTELYGVEVTYD